MLTVGEARLLRGDRAGTVPATTPVARIASHSIQLPPGKGRRPREATTVRGASQGTEPGGLYTSCACLPDPERGTSFGIRGLRGVYPYLAAEARRISQSAHGRVGELTNPGTSGTLLVGFWTRLAIQKPKGAEEISTTCSVWLCSVSRPVALSTYWYRYPASARSEGDT